MSDNSETLLKYSDQLVEVTGEAAVQQNFEARKKSELPSLDGKPSIEELLNVIFPPRVLHQEGRSFHNPVCFEEASRKELDELEARLEARLHERQARYVAAFNIENRGSVRFERTFTTNCSTRSFGNAQSTVQNEACCC